MLRFLHSFAAFVATSFLSVHPTAEAGLLDQSSLKPDSVFSKYLAPGREIAQTFTVSRTGFIDRIDLSIQRLGSADTPPVVVEIQTLDIGAVAESNADVIGAVEASASLFPKPTSGSPGIEERYPPEVAIDFRDAGVFVKAGMQLAIVLRTSAPVIADQGPAFPPFWVYSADDYTGGAGYFRLSTARSWSPLRSRYGTFDWFFRTYVTIPEPTALTLATLLAFSLVGRRR